jgi:hypothetical protein
MTAVKIVTHLQRQLLMYFRPMELRFYFQNKTYPDVNILLKHLGCQQREQQNTASSPIHQNTMARRRTNHPPEDAGIINVLKLKL